MYNNQIRVKASNPGIPVVTAIVDEPEPPKFNIVDVSVERQYTDPLSWKMYLVDDQGRNYEYDLHFS